MADINEIINDPSWFPIDFDKNWENIHFAKTSPSALRQAPFLDNRFHQHLTTKETVPIASLLDSPAYQQRCSTRLPVIFHSAFCCSTLAAKACDIDKACLSLKEPHILMALANAKRVPSQTANMPCSFDALFTLVTSLLAREFSNGEKILLKPTNVANNLIQDFLKTGSTVVFMYSELKNFLISILKKGEHGKGYIRTQYNIFSLDPSPIASIPQRTAMTFTDLQVAALIWRHQMELFTVHINQNQKNTFSLKDTDFLNNKEKSITCLSQIFSLKISPAAILDTIAGPVFQTDVKFSNLQYGATEKTTQSMQIYDKYADDIEMILLWAKQLRLGSDLHIPLRNALLK